jgi:hypothetical protein
MGQGVYYGTVIETNATNTSLAAGYMRVSIPYLIADEVYAEIPFAGTTAPPNGTTAVVGFSPDGNLISLGFIGWESSGGGGAGTQGPQGFQGNAGANGSRGYQGYQGTAGGQGAGGALGYWGSFYDTTTQSCATTNTAYGVLCNTTAGSNGVNVDPVIKSRLIFDHSGVYNLQFSSQFENQGGGGSGTTVRIWLRVNGTNIVESAGSVDVNNNSPLVVSSWNYVLQLYANDYVELMWATTNTHIVMLHNTTATPAPGTPSVIFTATQVMYTQEGPQGFSGAQGYQGNQGSTGIFEGATPPGDVTLVWADTSSPYQVGPQGYQGYQGAGYQGSQGSQGYQGVTGVYVNATAPSNTSLVWADTSTAFSVGPQGYQGATGSQGNQGSTGPQGSQGTQGTNGSQGSTGTQGLQGYQGYQGYQGKTGVYVNATAPTDTSLVWADTSTAFSVGPQGYQGNQGNQGAGYQGVQGATGSQGYQGNQGLTGAGTQGSQGASGSQGNQGAQGAAGSAPNAWTTGQYTTNVTISSTNVNAVNPGSQNVTVSGFTTYFVIYNCNESANASTTGRAINLYFIATGGSITGVGSTSSNVLILGNTNNVTGVRANHAGSTIITTSTTGSVTFTPWMYLGGTTDTVSMALFSMQVIGIR